MGAKGKVTSLVTKRDLNLATKIEEAIRKNESLEAITKESVQKDITRNQITEHRRRNKNLGRVSKVEDKSDSPASSENTKSDMRSGKQSPPAKSSKKGFTVSKSVKSPGKSSRPSSLRNSSSSSENKRGNSSRNSSSSSENKRASSSRKTYSSSENKRESSSRKASSSSENKRASKRTSASKSTDSKLSVVGFRGRNSSSNKKQSHFDF